MTREEQNSGGFGSVLRALKAQHQLSFRDIADDADVSVAYLSDLAQGRRRPPSNEIIKRLGVAFGGGEATLRLFQAAAEETSEVTLPAPKSPDAVLLLRRLSERLDSLHESDIKKINRMLG